MKKLLCLVLSVLIVFGMCACGTNNPAEETTTEPEETMPPAVGFAPHPMARKEYVPTEGATPEELRAIAVEAMRDELSIQWNTDKFFYYKKRVGLTGKKYTFSPEVVFAGMPYTDGASGLFQWMEFYDSETGLFSFPDTGTELNVKLGNSCANAIISAWNTVCNSMPNAYATYVMVQSNGFLPVGPYTYTVALPSLKAYGTDLICADNGKEVMLASYAEILPADALVSTADEHAVMACEAAHVEYLEDGSIDGEKSYVAIMDQRAGKGDFFYVEKDGDTDLLHSGRTRYEYTFNELWELSYIPCTSAEFIGEDPYETAEVSYSIDAYETVDEMLKGSVIANYPIAVTRLVLEDKDGQETILSRILLRNNDISTGKAYNLPTMEFAMGLKEQAYLDAVASGEPYTLRIVTILMNGQEFTPAEITIG